MIMRWFFYKSYINNSLWLRRRAETEAARSAQNLGMNIYTIPVKGKAFHE